MSESRTKVFKVIDAVDDTILKPANKKSRLN